MFWIGGRTWRLRFLPDRTSGGSSSLRNKEKKKENNTTDIENIVVTSSVKKEVTQSSLLQNFVTSQPFVLARKLKDEKGTR